MTTRSRLSITAGFLSSGPNPPAPKVTAPTVLNHRLHRLGVAALIRSQSLWPGDLDWPLVVGFGALIAGPSDLSRPQRASGAQTPYGERCGPLARSL